MGGPEHDTARKKRQLHYEQDLVLSQQEMEGGGTDRCHKLRCIPHIHTPHDEDGISMADRLVARFQLNSQIAAWD